MSIAANECHEYLMMTKLVQLETEYLKGRATLIILHRVQVGT